MNKEFKGTKGEWQTDKTQSMVVDELGRCIAEIYCPSELYPEMQDNCKLLAAAPELLEYAVMEIIHTKGAANSSKVIGLNGMTLYEGVSHGCVKFIENYRKSAIEKALNIKN